VLRLRVDPLTPLEIIPTRAELIRARDPFTLLQSALGSVTMSAAYGRYLDSPDPQARSDASYEYRSVPKAAVAAPRTDDEGDDTLAILLGVALGALALGGVAALWARS